MIHAYNDMYLSDARRVLAGSFDHAVYTFGTELSEYYHYFVKSDLADRFERGDPFVVSGRSGIELARDVIERMRGEEISFVPLYHDNRSPEYWVGWALAYYQWYTDCSLRLLDEEVPIEVVLTMYDKYHEMDIMHFVERINDLRSNVRSTTYLRKYREMMGYSQGELAYITGIPVRTLQQYEQGRKALSRARVDYVISLSKALNVDASLLIEGTCRRSS